MKREIVVNKKWLGGKIRKRRLQLDISQRDLARLLKINPASVCDWEKGRSFPTLDKLFLVAKELGLEVSIDNTDITEAFKD